jgi:asparagine synthase (glutamine-hydrolysing)
MRYGPYAIVFNGEIYNYREIRRELTREGHRFRTQSDTEVLLHAYAAYGAGCLDRLNGMFAFAIWDAKRRQFFLARDRMGEKPLYYIANGGVFAFASELAPLLRWSESTLDPARLSMYFTFNYIPSPGSIVHGIRKLPPASALVLGGPAHTPQVRTYWEVPARPEPARSERNYVDMGRRLLLESVRRRLVADVPVGAFLSGGIDSSLIVGLVRRLAGRRVETFSACFEEEGYDERRYAALAARAFGTDHHELVLRPKRIDPAEVITRLDEPFADPALIPTYYLSKFARKRVTVALSGDGGDELFGGYPNYFRADRERRYLQWTSRVIAPFKHAFAEGRSPFARLMRRLGMTPEERYASLLAKTDARTKRMLLPELANRADPVALVRSLIERGTGGGFLHKLLYVDLHQYLPENCMTKLDRASMLASLEARPPFLDHELIEFAMRIPTEIRMRGGEPKYLLKKMAAGIVPPEIIRREKAGFNLPVKEWIRGPWQQRMRRALTRGKLVRMGIIDGSALGALLEAHCASERNYAYPLWIAYTLELWCREHMGRSA